MEALKSDYLTTGPRIEEFEQKVASSNCVLYCGGETVFADIKPHTYNIDPIDIERKITDKTQANYCSSFYRSAI